MSAEDVERCEAHLREREGDLLAAMVDALEAVRERIACARDHRAKYTTGLAPADLVEGARVLVAQLDADQLAGREWDRMERARVEWLRAVSTP